MGPSPPSHEIGNEEKDLKKHIRVQLHLENQKEDQCNINYSKRPAPHISARGEPDCYTTRDYPYELKIAHGITQYGKENIFYVEKTHMNYLILPGVSTNRSGIESSGSIQTVLKN